MEANATTSMEIWKNNMPAKDERNCGSAIKGHRTGSILMSPWAAMVMFNNIASLSLLLRKVFGEPCDLPNGMTKRGLI